MLGVSSERASSCSYLDVSYRVPPSNARVVSVDEYPVPEGRQEVFMIGRPRAGRASLPLRDVARWIPKQLPVPLEQSNTNCSGGMIEVSLSNGQTISYGPSAWPYSLERLVTRAAAVWNRLIARSVPWTPPETGAPYLTRSLGEVVWIEAGRFQDIHARVLRAHLGRDAAVVFLRGHFTCTRCEVPYLQKPVTSGTRLEVTIERRTFGVNVRLSSTS